MAIDMTRRKSVMSRSIKLGHCVCNPKLPCPCPVFKEHNVCTCAGERLPVKQGDIPLTKYVKKAGCASKIGQADLRKILSCLPEIDHPSVLLGAAAGDDAGIYKLDDRYSLVQTVDVFSPAVDDPYLFGQISAANSLSDVYAMGGKPITALSIVGFPIEELDGEIMQHLLKGGMDKLNEAECPLIGGHSINDEEIKCGFSITGLIDTDKVVERDRAKPGDVLILTKPLGTGMVAFAAQIGRISKECLDEAGASMATLNKDAAELMVEHGANACTDITGFGLAGHLVEMVRGSGVIAEIDFSKLPVFGAVKVCLEQQIFAGAIENNQQYAMAWVEVLDESNEDNLPILYDPQTSGGLLVSMPEEKGMAFLEAMHRRGHACTAVIGRIIEKGPKDAEGKLVVINTRLENYIGTTEGIDKGSEKEPSRAAPKKENPPVAPAAADTPCCESPPGLAAGPPAPSAPCCDSPPGLYVETPAVDALPVFMEFMHKASEEGAVDQRAKKLIWIALSVGFRCEPCIVSHLKGAVDMGISKAEIDEAANIGIAFGGCSAMLLFRKVCMKQKI